MLLIVGTFRLPPENTDQALPAMEAMILASRAEQGCLEYSYAQDVLDLGLIHVTETWADREALDQHFASEHIAQWRASWPGLGISDRDLKLSDVAQHATV